MKRYNAPMIKTVIIENSALLQSSPGLCNEMGDSGRSFLSRERDDYDDDDSLDW